MNLSIISRKEGNMANKPIPDFEKLFQEADKRQEEALKTFRREVRRYNKIWRACGGDVKTYLEVVNSGG